MEVEVNVKAIEHFSGLLYGNNLGNSVNHMVHGRDGAPSSRSSPFLSKPFLTQARYLMEGWLRPFKKIFLNFLFIVLTLATRVFLCCSSNDNPFKKTFQQNLACCLFVCFSYYWGEIADEFREEGKTWIFSKILQIQTWVKLFQDDSRPVKILAIIKIVLSILDVITGKHPGRAERTLRQRNVSQCGHLIVWPWACFLSPLGFGFFIYKMVDSKCSSLVVLLWGLSDVGLVKVTF